MRVRLFPAIVLFISLSCAWMGGCGALPQTSVNEADPELYLDHVKFLAGDALAGRRPGTEGIERAADYIGVRFAAAGLAPAGEDGTYFQHFEVVRGKRLDSAAASLELQGIDTDWQIGADWTPLPYSTDEVVSGPLAFAGFGINATEYGYNDYENFDANGKILLIFRYEPASVDAQAEFGGENLSDHSYFATKDEVAAREGAKALVLVNPTRADTDESLYSFAEESPARTGQLPLIHVTRAVAEEMLSQAGMDDLDTLQQRLESGGGPLSADMGLTIEVDPGIHYDIIASRNVIGLLKGGQETTDTIVVGAHYDHLGNVPLQFDPPDDTRYIHNGADDNASGTAGVLELARVLAQEPSRRRDILFIAFSAEEVGLVGSSYFVNHPTVPLDRIRAMVNLDMIGRYVPGDFQVDGTYTAAEFPEMVRRAAQAAGFECRTPAGITSDSDHASFYDKGIPVLFPFTGFHDQYHRPEDDWQLINAEGAAAILNMFRQIVVELASMPSGPAFQEDTAALKAFYKFTRRAHSR
jgi:hypothetical protein